MHSSIIFQQGRVDVKAMKCSEFASALIDKVASELNQGEVGSWVNHGVGLFFPYVSGHIQ